jgi:hypothetical protein
MKKTPVGMIVALLLLSSPAMAMTVLKGKEAEERIGDPKTHFLQSDYTFNVLSRSHRDAMHGRFSDGVIFNAGGGLFKFVRRKMGDVEVVLDSPEGRETEPVTEEAWKAIANTLSDDNDTPYLFLDDSGAELAVVYIGSGTKLQGKLENGLLRLTLEVEGAKALQQRGRRRMM